MKKAIKKILGHKLKKADYLFSGLDKAEVTSGPMIFCTGMGRSGTHFLASLLNLDKNIDSYHLDEIGNPVADSFYQYSKWFGLEVDPSPLFASRAFLASKAAAAGKVYFESNPYLNLHVSDLAKQFSCKILIIYRQPKKVVESHYNKGWYENFTPKFSPAEYQAPGYGYGVERAHHFFGRFFPRQKEEFEKWQQYSQVGKISWMWQVVYKNILADISTLDNVMIVRTEQINFEIYSQICDFLEIDKSDSQKFQQVLDSKPGKATYHNRPKWNTQETSEFELLTNEVFNSLENHPLKLKA